MCDTSCRPLYKVRAVTITPTIVTLTVNRLFADIGQNAPFRLCIARGILPRNNTGQIIITDGVVTLTAFGFQGNLLRNDSLLEHVDRRGYCNVALDAYKGGDLPHVTIFNRMCASSFLAAEVTEPAPEAPEI